MGSSVRSRCCRGGLKLGPGTLYGALDRLSEDGLIEPTRTEVVNGRLRRYYAITPIGLAALRAEMDRRSETLRAAQARLPRPPGVVPT